MSGEHTSNAKNTHKTTQEHDSHIIMTYTIIIVGVHEIVAVIARVVSEGSILNSYKVPKCVGVSNLYIIIWPVCVCLCVCVSVCLSQRNLFVCSRPLGTLTSFFSFLGSTPQLFLFLRINSLIC